jgi:hypothetical protein
MSRKDLRRARKISIDFILDPWNAHVRRCEFRKKRCNWPGEQAF